MKSNQLTIKNADGTIAIGSTGFNYAISTLTEIKSQVIDQKLYEIPVADYMPVDVGQAAWNDEIVQNVAGNLGGSFYQGDVKNLTGNGNIASVNAVMGNVRIPTELWAKQFSYTVMEVEQALQSGNWDPIESKMKSLKKNWDLGIQETAFLGHPVNTDLTGLINHSEVNINTTLITTPISEMDATEFNTFVAGIMAAFFANSASTAMPNKFVIPTADYLGLATFAPTTGGVAQISRLEFLLNAFQRITGNAGFEILPLVYAQSDNALNIARGISKNRYTLYNDDVETLNMNIPVDFNMLDPGTTNNIMFSQAAYGQYSGVLVPRVREILYFDETAAS